MYIIYTVCTTAISTNWCKIIVCCWAIFKLFISVV